MKKHTTTLLLLACVLALSACASAPPTPPVVARCPAPQPVDPLILAPEMKLSPDQLQRDLLDDTPTTTASSRS